MLRQKGIVFITLPSALLSLRSEYKSLLCCHPGLTLYMNTISIKTHTHVLIALTTVVMNSEIKRLSIYFVKTLILKGV